MTDYYPQIFVACVSLICFAAVGVMEIWEAGEKRKRQARLMHLDRLRREAEMEEKRKQYRKVVRTDPPALVRIKELGWRQGCGHSMHQWDSDRLVCLQCVLEGRQVARDMGNPNQ